MNKKSILTAMIILIIIPFVAGWSIGNSSFFNTESKEMVCLNLYMDINEISRTPEMSVAERHAVEQHKNWIFKYVEKDCPNFIDLEFMYNNYKQNILVSEPEFDYELDETEFLQIKNNMENIGYHICNIQLEENKILIVLNWIFEDSEPEKMILSQIPSNVSYEIKYLDGYADYFISKESVFSCEGLENEK